MIQHGFHQTYETQPSHIMFLNSQDGITYANTSHFSYNFNEGIETSAGEGVLVSLVSASIPYSFYNIRSGVNNRIPFKISNYDHSSAHVGSLLIDPGNYTALSLASAIKTQLEALHESTAAPECTVTIAHDRITQKFTFQIQQKDDTNGRRLTLQYHTTNFDDMLFAELGFSTDQDVHTSDDGSGSFIKLTSQHVADLGASVHAVYIHTSLATRSVLDSQTGGISDILTKIDINTNPGGVITLDPAQATHESLIYAKSIKDIYIRVTDERDRLLDLNGLNLQVALKFRFVEWWKASFPLLDPRLSPASVPVPQNVKPTKAKARQNTRKKKSHKSKDK